MYRNYFLKTIFLGIFAVLALATVGRGASIPAKAAVEHKEMVFFAFDDESMQFQNNVELHLVSGQKQGIVLSYGKPGDPDCDFLFFYGSVLRVGDEFRMYYIGREYAADEWKTGPFKICYAVSKDGIHWEKPKLGIVDYHGNKNNNLIGVETSDGKYEAPKACEVIVLYEPNDPNPDKHYKMLWEVFTKDTTGPSCVAFSADGLRWKPSPKNPVSNLFLEPSGLVNFNGCYYVNGQVGCRQRNLTTMISYDFENWSLGQNIAFRRNEVPRLTPKFDDIHKGKQVHLGASLWNRGNVLVGFYGMWEGAPGFITNTPDSREFMEMHLGLVVSNDAIHYREPIKDFEIISGYNEPDAIFPRICQGQAFENVGDKTYVWYSGWSSTKWARPYQTGQVRLATWDRDRLGWLEAKKNEIGGPDVKGKPIPDGVVTTCPIVLGKNDKIFINADGLSENSSLSVELIDEQLRPIKGFGEGDFDKVTKSGLRVPVTIKGKDTLNTPDKPVRIQLRFKGDKYMDIKLYAIYAAEK